MEGSTEITGVSFGFFDPKDVVAMSVQEIDVSMTFDELGMPIPGGLYDPALGPTSVQGDICPTCHLGYKSCPGHVGHISLSVPVYNPLTFDSLVRLMKYKCACCHRLKRRRDEVRRFVVKCGLIDMGQWKHALELDREIAECAGDLDAKNETKRSHEVEVLTRHEANLARYRQNVASGKRAKHVLHTHERQSREKIVKEFMKGMPLPSRKCMNCGAFSPLLRKDGYTKLFQKDLLPKQIKDNHNNGTVFKPLLSDSDMKAVLAAADALDGKAKGGKKSKKKKAQADKINEDMQHSSDEEEDSDGDAGHADTFDDSGDRGAMDGAHRERREQYLAPTLVRRMLQVLWHRESAALELIWSTPGGTSSSSSASLIDPADASSMARGVDLFFMSTIPVCPSRFRPPTNMGDMQIEHPLNTYLKQILNTNEELMLAKQGNDGGDNMLMDSDSGSDSSDSGSDSDIDTKKKDKKLSIEPAVKAISNTDMVKTWVKLQESVNCLIDSSRSSTPDMPSGVRQVLEKKEGLFRRNMMGKRVNFACRSVISPDPYIDTHEVGLPLRFAKKLTFPEPVTPFNFDSLRQAVVNGPDVHPGANYVEDEFGMKVDLARRTKEEREAIAQMLRTPAVNAPPGKCKIVYRQLVSGDVMLANRQPTLHKPSIMAHVARVLPNPTWQTIRLHYANCNTYNADFDGDEINLHFPQSQHARAEAYEIAQTSHQYIVPTDGSPLRGLIQDNVGNGVLLTKRDTFLTRDMYQQLIMGCAHNIRNGSAHMQFHTPAILKPKVLYTGKQVISTLLDMLMFDPSDPNNRLKDAPPMNMTGKTKLKPQASGWGTSDDFGEHKVMIRGNWLLRGVLDKSQFGASSHGLVHSFYEVYGSIKAGSLLTSLCRLFVHYGQMIGGYTCSIHDMILVPEADKDRQELIRKSEKSGLRAASEWASAVGVNAQDEDLCNKAAKKLRKSPNALRSAMKSRIFAEGKGYSVLDDVYKKETMASGSAIIKRCLPGGLIRPFPVNCMSLMVQTGAKGSMVNHSQISCLLGQQELEGHRVPVMVSGKSLPSFPAFDARPRAGGFISDRFLTGIRPQDYFFHCMSGREGLVDTAVKTSRSGYLQRCLIKHMEDLKVCYDYTVRDSDGSVIQFQYGEDSVDTTKTPFLGSQEKEIDFLISNMPALMHKFAISEELFDSVGMIDDAYARRVFDRVSAAKSRYEVMKLAKEAWEQNKDSKAPRPELCVHDTVEMKRLATPVLKKQSKTWSFLEAWDEGRGLRDRTPGAAGGEWCEARVVKVRGGGIYDVQFARAAVGDEVIAMAGEKWDPRKAQGEEGWELEWKPQLAKVVRAHPDGTFDVIFEGAAAALGTKTRVGMHRIQCLTLKRVPQYVTYVPRGNASDGQRSEQADILRIAVPDPPNSVSGSLNFTKHIGAVSERLQKLIDDYCAKPDKQRLLAEHGLNKEALEVLLWVKHFRSLADPGEAVGALAGQSIGEPSTQMTLNTFHLAGVGGGNVTLGIPRLREILMTASKTLKTPLMYLPIRPELATTSALLEARELADKVSQQLGVLTLDELLDHNRRVPKCPAVVVTEKIHRAHPMSPAQRRYTIRLHVARLDAIAKAYGTSFQVIKEAFGIHFLPKLLTKCGMVLKQSGAITSISVVTGGASKSKSKKKAEIEAEDDASGGTGIKTRADIVDIDSEDEQVGGGDEDEAMQDDEEQGSLRFAGRKQQIGYGEDEEEESDSGSGSGSSSGSGSGSDSDAGASPAEERKREMKKAMANSSKSSGGSTKSGDGVPLIFEVAPSVKRSPLFFSAKSSANPSKDQPGAGWLEVTLDMPIEYKKIMMLALVEQVVKDIKIFSTRRINKTYVLPPARGNGPDSPWRVQTDGVNFQAAWQMRNLGVDADHIMSNDIHAVLDTYGVEAARCALVKEVLGVFGVYGIEVDPRHLALIADYMTFEGGYKPMNRMGIDGSASPFLKMSFETSMKFLTQATVQGRVDNTESPSARIVLGRIVGNGTGCCDVRMDYSMVAGAEGDF